MAHRFDDETLARLRTQLMNKSQDVATLLAELLAGKRSNAPTIPGFRLARPGLTPAERARLFLELLQERRALLDAGDDRFGRCELCGEDLGAVALTELPWADRCQSCASK